ncbi:MAG: ABC transporter substrate-binding protein [Bacteroidetes bacterium]|nr:ABC transporter substrate-binding protein [Bacteroidota bacterium]
MSIKSFFVIILAALITACTQVSDTKQTHTTSLNAVPLHYAKRFAIKTSADVTVLELLGNKTNNDVTATFVLYKNQQPDYGKDVYYIKTPVNRVACMSSIYTTMLTKLHAEGTIVAIDNVDYYNDAHIQQKVKEGSVIELSRGPKVELEKTLALKPDLFLTFGMGNPKNDVDVKLIQAQLPIAISLDHLEETPLARAEWIKFFSYFFNKEQLADSLYTITEKRYLALKNLTTSLTKKPTVLTEIKYGDAWYVPSGKSYMAHLINDAGGDYFWKDDNKTGSTPLSFETVYAKAKDCDYWINQYQVNNKKDLTGLDERYGLFKAFKEGHLYNNNKVQNAKGYSNYWETGITNPDDVLADLIAILSPALLPNHEFVFYKKIE